MQAIARRAKDLRKINSKQYEHIFKLINYHGYRKQEPLCGVTKEKPIMLKYVLNYYFRELGYSKEQLCEFLNINKKDYNKMYGLLLGDYIEDKSKKKTHLTIVKD